MKLKMFTKSTLANAIGVVIATYLVLVLAQTVKRNNDLKHQITALQSQISDLKDEQAQLSYDIRYYQTDGFKEKAARAKLGLQDPGEGVIILPGQSSGASASQSATSTKKGSSRSNLGQWLDFLTGRAG